MAIEKFNVCKSCLSIGILDNDCICTYSNYETIELEFMRCDCCGEIKDEPIDSDFNKEQFEKLENKRRTNNE